MKKVYLLTFHGSVNYGAVLQAYALSKTLNNMPCECKVIDYNRKRHHKNFLTIQKTGLKSIVVQLLQLPSKYFLHRKFNRFTKTKMDLTQSYNGHTALFEGQFENDAVYITGSDQVFNCQLTEDNFHYFFDFTDSPNKYSYAASFGVSDIDDWKSKDIVLDLLKRFKSISVREESGQQIIKNHLGIDSKVVCDPTFLLNKDQWAQISVTPDDKNYIALFMLARNEELINQAKEFAKEKGLRIINLAYTVKGIEGIEDKKNLSPQEWLGYIKNAQYVFTNSFHGFALSLNFNKQVWVALSKIGRNSRIVDLANRYGVSDRIIVDVINKSTIDYDMVTDRICADRTLSRQFLEAMINE